MRIKFRFRVFLSIVLFILVFASVFLPEGSFTREIKNTEKSWGKILTFFELDVYAQPSQTAFVATNSDACGDHTPCYINTDGVDGLNGLGTGLRQAVSDLNDGDEIVILGNYTIKDHTVLIDKNLTIRGDENTLVTYTGNDCSMPMLNITNGGSIQKLTINGGNCAGVSRDLITINSPQDISIENNTFQEGHRAINIIQNDGKISVAFNHITENQDYALYQENGTGNGSVEIYANNIFSNRTGIQVYCNNLGSADHNYWGQGVLAEAAVGSCEFTNGKMLGAPISSLPNQPGVQAIRQNVSDIFAYAFDENIGVKRNSGNDYDLIIVNHGQGSEDNIPFLITGSTPITACSNFYDVFLANGAVASDLVLSLKYDLNNACIAAVESSDFCSQDNSSKYPLWWYDPFSNLTDGWDRTGQIPDGENPLDVAGQNTSCDLDKNEIQVVIDSSGRPGISQDLNFTPFLAGLPIGSSSITTFNAYLDVDEVNLYWETAQESKIFGYHVLRANSETGPYYRLSSLIPSTGSNSIYEFTDLLDSVEFNKNYYYKIEIINSYGDTLRTHGPVSILTSTPTPTLTQTRTQTPTRTLYPTRTPYPTSTPFPTRTATLYYYRSPTSIYRPFTSTPYGTPTQVRTDRPSQTGILPTDGERFSQTPEPSTGTPEEITRTSTENPRLTPLVQSDTPLPDRTPTATKEVGIPPGNQGNQRNSWLYLLLGGAAGLGILGAVSLYFYKEYFL